MGCHTSYSVKHLLIDCTDLTPKRIFLHCKQYERTIWTCQSRQNTSISKSSWSIKKNLNLQYSICVYDANTKQPNQQKLALNNLKKGWYAIKQNSQSIRLAPKHFEIFLSVLPEWMLWSTECSCQISGEVNCHGAALLTYGA